jgi:hypothetical protein
MKPKRDLSAIRSALKAKGEKKTTGGNNRNFGDMYPFWNIEEGQKAIIRVLPYAGIEDDATNPFVDKLEHVISINGEDKKIPCLNMYGEKCPICALSAKYYKSDGKGSVKGKYYWRDKKSLASVYVVKDPLPVNEETGENDQGKQKIVQLGNQLSGKYEKAFIALLEDEDDPIDDVTWDLENGRNFAIVKDMKGEYANYESSSNFASKSTSLPAEFIESFEPVDLRKYLPENPGLEKVQRMLDAHLSGEDFEDDDKPVASKPKAEEAVETKPAATKTAKVKVVEQAEDSEEEEVPKTVKKTAAKPVVEEAQDSVDEDGEEDDFLAKLKRRKGG